jgi:DNA polymerase-3 subunit delta'
MSEIIGHENILNFFEKVRTQGVLNHAYCFSGPAHVGKRRVAEHVSTELLGMPKEKLLTSPDFVLVRQEINEKTGKLRKDISIDQIRNLISHLSSKSFAKDGYKIALIERADLLSTSASNALLKTLEEPRSKTILFLITPDEQKLLPTIQSRCQMIYFSLVQDHTLNSYIDSHVSDAAHRERMKKYAHGMPGKVVSWIEEPESFDVYLNESNRFKNLLDKNFHEKIQSVEDLFGDKTDHIQAREHLQDVLAIWKIELHEQIVHNSGSNLLAIESKISHAKKLLAQNVHPRLLVEQILLEM